MFCEYFILYNNCSSGARPAFHRMGTYGYPMGQNGRVALVRTDDSEERIACIIRVIRIGKLGTMLGVTSNRSMLLADSCHPDDGGDTFLRNVSSYKSHTA
jgi:hypothetical protein